MKERKRPTMQKTWLDRAADVIDSAFVMLAPEYGARRVAVRASYRAAAYRAAQMSGTEAGRADQTRSGSWLGSKLSADSELEVSRDTVCTRSRELFQNDPIGGAIEALTDLVVGTGCTPQSQVIAGGEITEAMAQKWRDELDTLYDRVQGTACVDGVSSLWECHTLASNSRGYAGEYFIVFSDIGGADRTIPLCIEVVDDMRCETPPEMSGNKLVRMGIEKNTAGKIIAYWFRTTHPGDTLDVSYTYKRIPADRVCHVFKKLYAGQSRGWPWLTRTLNRIKDVKDLDEATVIAAQVASCYAAFVKTTASPASAAYGAASEIVNNKQMEDIHPGTIKYLGQNEEIQFASPTNPGANFSPFMEWQHRRMAAGMNFPYEIVAKNWSGTSFSGGRLVLAGARLTVKALQRLDRERFLSRWWNRMVEEAVILGVVSIPPALYFRNQYAINSHHWSSQPWPFALTPREEIEAAVLAINNNLDTKQRIVGETGFWYEDVAKQRSRERMLEDELGIVPPNANGTPGQTEPAEDPQDEPEEPTDVDAAESEAEAEEADA